jgi:hypothetical protein
MGRTKDFATLSPSLLGRASSRRREGVSRESAAGAKPDLDRPSDSTILEEGVKGKEFSA